MLVAIKRTWFAITYSTTSVKSHTSAAFATASVRIDIIRSARQHLPRLRPSGGKPACESRADAKQREDAVRA